MNPALVQWIGGILTALLGGSLVKSLLDYRKDRRQALVDGGAQTMSQVLAWNLRLQEKVTELEEELDKERNLRRSLEDRVAKLEREQGRPST